MEMTFINSGVVPRFLEQLRADTIPAPNGIVQVCVKTDPANPELSDSE